ncbi:hypothetical protein LCGC14_1451800 [marine sediment metagenome]|uniref:Uncharacterized protein n=1 Tax=marine sediment metagenome TaxID=412755 RepID=A0A0F9JHK0_9ZZZZ
MVRERNEVIYSIRVEDIYLSAESLVRETDLTPDVLERVIQKLEALDTIEVFGEMIDDMLDDAIEEEQQDVTIH